MPRHPSRQGLASHNRADQEISAPITIKDYEMQSLPSMFPSVSPYNLVK